MTDDWNQVAPALCQWFEKASHISIVVVERWSDHISRWLRLGLQWTQEPGSWCPESVQDGVARIWNRLGTASPRGIERMAQQRANLKPQTAKFRDPAWLGEFQEGIANDGRDVTAKRSDGLEATLERREKRWGESEPSDEREQVIAAQEAQITAFTAEGARLGRLFVDPEQRLQDFAGLATADRKAKAKKGKADSV